ncbi:MAG TPA: hypothetical protein EYP22_02280 [Methanosarcinales archaeon]|nr:hypothetical protein [Methanosarcinales archaeon]
MVSDASLTLLEQKIEDLYYRLDKLEKKIEAYPPETIIKELLDIKEEIGELREKVEDVKHHLTEINEKIDKLNGKSSDIEKKLVEKQEFKTEISGVKAGLKTEISKVKAELKAEISEVKKEISELKAEQIRIEKSLTDKIHNTEIKLSKDISDLARVVSVQESHLNLLLKMVTTLLILVIGAIIGAAIKYFLPAIIKIISKT